MKPRLWSGLRTARRSGTQDKVQFGSAGRTPAGLFERPLRLFAIMTMLTAKILQVNRLPHPTSL
jgi:hypothetical protein